MADDCPDELTGDASTATEDTSLWVLFEAATDCEPTSSDGHLLPHLIYHSEH
jgi:hypothetical protein